MRYLIPIVFFLSSFASSPAPVFAADDLTSLQAAFLKGEYAKVSSRAEQLLSRKQPPHIRENILYLQGIAELKLHNLEAAQSALLRLIQEFPESRWVPLGQMALAEGYSRSGEEEKVLRTYQELLKDEKSKEIFPQVWFRLGNTQRRLGRWEEARSSLESLVAQFPGSQEAALSRELLDRGEFAFSVQVGAFIAKANAFRLESELRRRGYPVEVSETSLEGRRFHRVRVGRFAHRQQAIEEQERLRREGFPGKVVP